MGSYPYLAIVFILCPALCKPDSTVTFMMLLPGRKLQESEHSFQCDYQLNYSSYSKNNYIVHYYYQQGTLQVKINFPLQLTFKNFSENKF